MKISDVMSHAMVAKPDISVRGAAKIMSRKEIESLIIEKKNKIIGIITERDIIKNVGKLDRKISSIMSKRVVSIDGDDNLDNAAIAMREHKIKRLPVIRNDKLVGIITATDILANSEELNENFFFD